MLIHANSNMMRQWLWKDILNNTVFFHSSMCIVHAICSVIGVFIVCSSIDIMRIIFIERPFFKIYDTKIECMIHKFIKLDNKINRIQKYDK